jgi:hypothetical protein
MKDISIRAIHWKPAWRVIPTRYPEVDLYERVAEEKDIEAIKEIESLTNNRVRLQEKAVTFLRSKDHFTKSCSEDILAAFAYRSDGRFTKVNVFGAFYISNTLKTAAFEKAHHYMQFLIDAHMVVASSTQMRVIKAEIKAMAHDIRGLRKTFSELYHPTNYKPAQEWAQKLWSEGSEGIVYDSVRNPGGQCAAIFSPQNIAHCHKERILTYSWDGKQTISISPVQEFLRFKRT